MSSGAGGSQPAGVERVAVVGAGMVGLATTWFLQQRGVHVTVLDRTGVAAGASWGNAGWITPALAGPLPEPAVLRYGVRAFLSPNSPVYVPLRPDAALIRFLSGFLRNSTASRWRRGMQVLAALDNLALDTFDELADHGVDATVHEATPLVAAYRTAGERGPVLDELAQVRSAGVKVDYDLLSGDAARAAVPLLSGAVGAGVAIHGQRFTDPGRYVDALARSVRSRGGELRVGVDVRWVEEHRSGVRVVPASGPPEDYDAVVIATGSGIGRLARPFGVRTVVQSGRGYSFSVATEPSPSGPVYFPVQRVACTPLSNGRLRVAGMMEFRPAEHPPDPRRFRAIVEAVRPLFRGVELDRREDEWVGARPVTPDGLPLVGPTSSSRVFVGGGHGMWGFALGPVTGRLLAEAVATGRTPAEIAPLDPLR